MMNPRGEKFVARMVMGGIASVLIGGFLFCVFFFFGIGQVAESEGKSSGGMAISVFGGLLAVAGIVMIIWGLASGLKFSSDKGSTQGARHLPEVVVASRFAVNSVGEMIFSNFEYDAPGGKLYVQLKFPDGHTEEFRTAWGVFGQCGEGMKGAALVNGSWISSFAPIMLKAEPLRDVEI